MRVGGWRKRRRGRCDHGEPTGIEAELLRQFALRLRARIDWQKGSESRLVAALEQGEVDVIIKVLFADADMNKADWLTASAAFIGVTGVGFGYWWTDAAAPP